MKKGKTSFLQGFKTAKIVYGTVDSINLKSLYLNIQTWVEPIYECDNWTRTVLNLSRSIKHSIYESINKQIFNENFIVDLDLRSSGLNLNKKSFMNLEINFYIIQEDLDFKGNEIKESLQQITQKIFKDNFLDNENFNFYLTKKSKLTEELLQTENV
jgi:5S rRNA maturation endonuclease (ribonuclease M5)